MIRFNRIPEPPTFDAQARQPGNQWLNSHPTAERPRDFWSQFKPDLSQGFNQLCSYSVMYEPVGTVDHYISFKNSRMFAYEWGNYRFASGWINSSKRNLDQDVLDPFEVGNDWFEILLDSLQLVMTENVLEEYRERAEYTIKKLHLRNDERVIRQRLAWYEMYKQGKLSLDGLKDLAPLIARAVEKKQASHIA